MRYLWLLLLASCATINYNDCPRPASTEVKINYVEDVCASCYRALGQSPAMCVLVYQRACTIFPDANSWNDPPEKFARAVVYYPMSEKMKKSDLTTHEEGHYVRGCNH